MSRLAWALILLAAVGCRRDSASSGREGHGPGHQRNTDSAEKQLGDVVQISVASEYACALSGGGIVRCWGTLDAQGGALRWHDAVPTRIPDLGPSSTIVVDHARAVALESTGRVMTWGRFVHPRYRLVPVSDTRPDHLVYEPVDESFDAALAERRFPGEVWSTGDWPPQERSTKRAMYTRMVSDDRVFGLDGGVCLYSASSELSCDFEVPELPFWQKNESERIEDLVEVVGSVHSDRLCLLFRSGAVRCWRTDDLEPGASGPTGWFDLEIPPVVQLAQGSGSYLALLEDGRVVEWNHLNFEPKVRPHVNGMKQVSAGILAGAGACGVDGAGAVWCWYPYFFRDEGHQPPHRIRGIANAVQVEVGGLHACARLADGRVQCWGHNQNGQCGTGQRTDVVKSPTFVVAPRE